MLWRVFANEPVEDCSLWNRFRLYIGLISFEQISALAACTVYCQPSFKARLRSGELETLDLSPVVPPELFVKRKSDEN